MRLIPLAFVSGVIVVSIAGPLIAGESELWIASVFAIIAAVAYFFVDRWLKERSRREERLHDDLANYPPGR
jgi:uncharacterized membrane protein YoaK (UPF0700 family)